MRTDERGSTSSTEITYKGYLYPLTACKLPQPSSLSLYHIAHFTRRFSFCVTHHQHHYIWVYLLVSRIRVETSPNFPFTTYTTVTMPTTSHRSRHGHHGHHHSSKGGGSSKGSKKEEYQYTLLWACCYCQRMGGMAVRTTLSCPSCDHFRCTTCEVEEVALPAHR